jgi:hypothetical protein
VVIGVVLFFRMCLAVRAADEEGILGEFC